MSDSWRPHGLGPTRLLCPWDFPGNSTGVDCHFLLQGLFPTQGSNPGLPHCRQTLYHLSHQGSPVERNGGSQKPEFSATLGTWQNKERIMVFLYKQREKSTALFCVLVAQSCPTLSHPTDYSLTGSSVHGIFQARILEWVAISFSRGSS